MALSNTARSGRAGSLLTVLIPAALLAGCQVSPDYVPPELELPDAWQKDLADDMVRAEEDGGTWWTALQDPLLGSLIQHAVQGSPQLDVAAARITEARALRGIVASERYPIVDSSGVVERRRISEGIIGDEAGGFPNRYNTLKQVRVDAVWEIDVWGRIARGVESADASIQASIENYRDVLVILHAEVASAYFQVRTLQARLQYAQDNAEAQRGTLGLTRDRFQAGITGELDVRQAELNLATTESTIPLLEGAIELAMNRLEVLLGEFPGALHDELMEPKPLPALPEQLALGLPGDLLRRRPDIRRAERELAAQTAQVGVATADLYPRFTLFGNVRLETARGGSVFDSGNWAGGIGPAFSLPIFNSGAIRSNIAAEDARTEAALAAYEQTVLLAVEDVEGALVSLARERERQVILTSGVEAAKRSVELVETQYRTGVTNFQNVLDTQRSQFQQQDALAETEGLVVLSLVQLYTAMGGAWASEPAEDGAAEDGAAEGPVDGAEEPADDQP